MYKRQRVKLAYFLSIEKAQPTIFVFDEPTTGLHFHDIKKLLEDVYKRQALYRIGNIGDATLTGMP